MRHHLSTLVLAGALAWCGGGVAFAQTASPPAAWTAADCEACHAKAATPAFTRSQHAKLDESCAGCHQNVAEHFKAQQEGDANGPVPLVKALSVSQINDTCLACHEKDGQASWHASAHDRRKVSCTACHSVHDFKSVKGQLKTRQDADTCYTCHKSERAKMMRTSHHPVREGKMDCSSCHNPHDGASVKMIKADSINELCYTCHTEKRGPFLFEHAAVREDCMSCHEPHGTNQARMLKQKAPNLCWNCHLTGSGHFGSGDNFSTQKGVQVAPPGSPSGYPTVNSRFIERSCRSCHVKLHGSNHPSGAYFVR